MRYCALSLLAALLVAGCGAPPTVIWKNAFDCGADEQAAGLAMTADGLVAVGTKTAETKTSWLIQTLGKDGNLRWRREYDQGEASTCSDVCTDAAGDILVTGTCRIKGSDMCVVVKFRPTGNIAWQKALSVGDASRAAGITLADSAIFVCGSVREKDKQELLVAKLDADGKTVWTKNFDFGPLGEAARVTAGPNGDIALVCRAGTPQNPDIVLMRLNAKGDSLWSRRYDSGAEDEPGDVAFDVLGNVLATGTGRAHDSLRCVILEYQPDGTLIRSTAYKGYVDAAGEGLFLTADGKIFIAASSKPQQQYELLAFEYLPDAYAVWEQRVVQAGADVRARDIAVDKDVFVLGTVKPATGQQDMVVARLAGPVQPQQ